MAIDGATLAAPATILFTAEAAPANPTPGPPTIDFCTDIQRRIFTCSCAYAGCHESATPRPATLDAGTGYPREGLDLSSPAGLLATAIGQVADESNTGPLAAVGSPSITQPFGIDMAVIAASEPGNSWLVYKTLLAIPDPPDAEVLPLEGGAGAYAQSLVTPVSASERAILSNFITGQAMPYPYPSTAEPSQGAITEGDIERLSLWIAAGGAGPRDLPRGRLHLPVAGGARRRVPSALMSALTESPAWKALARHHEAMRDVHVRSLFEDDPKRFERFSLEEADLLVDYSKHRVTDETMRLLLDARASRRRSPSGATACSRARRSTAPRTAPCSTSRCATARTSPSWSTART